MKVLDHPWVYWGLLFIGATCFFQADRIGQAIHRIRGRIDYMVAVQMGHENFISEVDAVRLIMNSQRAQARRARNEKPRSIFDSVPLSTLQSDPARDATNRMFSTWCRLALSRFDIEEKESIKEVGGKKEYDEVRLRTWLTGKYLEDITEEFGPI